jgi:hypothetical protein
VSARLSVRALTSASACGGGDIYRYSVIDISLECYRYIVL